MCEGLSIEQALRVAVDDPSLVWLPAAALAETVSDDDIRMLKRQATAAGDDMQMMTCERALVTDDEWSIADGSGGTRDLSHAQVDRLPKMTQEEARAACAVAIASAQAQE